MLVRRRHHPHVDLDRLLAADALELLLLQRAQQLHLHRRRHVADLVEEQRPAVGELEPPELLLDRTGERALLVAEQLALEQRLGQRGAVDLDERAVRAPAQAVDRARDQLLARAGLARDEHGRVGRRNALDQLQNRNERTAAADDFLEIVNRLDLLKEVRVLSTQAGLFLLHQDFLGDVHEHRPGELAAGVGPGPPLDPERLAVVPPAKLQDHTARVGPTTDGRERLAQTTLILRGVHHKGAAIGALDLIGRDPQRPHGSSVGADEARVQSFLDVGDGRLFEQVVVAAFALAQPLLRVQAQQLRRRPGGKNPEDEEFPRLGRHGAVVENGQMAECPALGVAERDAQVAVDAQLDQRLVGRILPADAGGMVAQAAIDHVLARGTAQVPFHVLDDRVPVPVRDRPCAPVATSRVLPIDSGEKFGDEGVFRADRVRQVSNKRFEELGSARSGRPFHDRTQRRDFIAFGDRLMGSRGERQPLRARSRG